MKQKDEQFEEDMRDIVRLYGRDERAAARDRQDEILSVFDSLGGDSKSFRRERARCSRAIIAEMYSPPRVSELARQLPKYECVPGLALDLTVLDSNGEPWDFSLKRMRDKAEKLIAAQQPTLLIGSPMCTAFSAWQHINRTKRPADVCERELIAGRVHLAWCCKLYKAQIARGAFFLHEHPGCATSWREDCVREVLALKGVARVVADQCQLGQETEGGDPIRKPTGFMSNSPCILGHLDRKCNGRRGLCSRPKGGEHQLCNGKVARRAAIFQRELCEAILRGIRDQLKQDRRLRENELGYTDLCGVMIDGDDECRMSRDIPTLDNAESKLGWAPLADEGMPGESKDQHCKRQAPKPKLISAHEDAVLDSILQMGRHDRFVDDLTGLPLPAELCMEARAKELEYFKEKNVWVIRKISESMQRMGRRPITVRWVETNKGDDANPRIRSRLVAREIRTAGEEAIFAPTPNSNRSE